MANYIDSQCEKMIDNIIPDKELIESIFKKMRIGINESIDLQSDLKLQFENDLRDLKISITEINYSDNTKVNYFSPRGSKKKDNRNELLMNEQKCIDKIQMAGQKLKEFKADLNMLQMVEVFCMNAIEERTENEIAEQSHNERMDEEMIMRNEVESSLDSILNKMDICKKLMNIDNTRVKLELDKVTESLENLKKKIG